MPNGDFIGPRLPNEFWEWARTTYSADEVALLRSGSAKANEQLGAIYQHWQGISPGTFSKATMGAFWQWAETKYDSGEMRTIKEDPNKYVQFYIYNIQGTQWDVGYPKDLPRGRPQPEKYGITENDWQVLMMVGGNEANVRRELDTWLSTGKINDYQARDIYDELQLRLRQADVQFKTTGYTEEEWPAEYERRQAEKARLKEQAYYQKLARHGQFFAPTTPRPKPFTEYGAGLEEMRAGFEETMPQTERWKDWFRSKYPRLTAQFEAKKPEERTKKTWMEYLEKTKPELRERWYGMTPYERGERPQVFQPRIQTVKWT